MSPVGVPGAQVPSFFSLGYVRGDAESCSPLPSPHSSHSLCGGAIRAAGVSLRSPSRTATQLLLRDYCLQLPTGSAGYWRRAARGWLGPALGWFASWELSGGRETGEGRGQVTTGGPACAAGPHDRQRPQAPWSFCRTHLGSLASTLPSEAALSERPGPEADAPSVEGEELRSAGRVG